MRPVLITAGATRNPIDAMRHISANASGRTGGILAGALMGSAKVTALVSPIALQHLDQTIPYELYGSTQDLCGRMKKWVDRHPNGLIIHSAAVGDYELDNHNPGVKLPSGQTNLVLHLRPTIKILDQLRTWSPSLRIASFKAAPPGTAPADVAQIGEAQRTRTSSDVVFANVIGDTEGTVSVIEPKETHTFPTRAEGLSYLIGRLLILAR